MAAQEFNSNHWTGAAVIAVILIIIVVIVISMMSFGQQQEMSQNRFSLNMKRSDGRDTMDARNRGNTMVIHNPDENGKECDLELLLKPNFKERNGRRILIKNNTAKSTITLVPTDGVTLDTGKIEDGLIVKPAAYAQLVYQFNGGSLLRLQ